MTGQTDSANNKLDPLSPLFFVSYSHSDESYAPNSLEHEPNWRFMKFFSELSENVAELISRGAGADPGYIDQSIAGGEQWTTELLKAVGTCQVFVALLSVRYIESDWCGKEWHAFSQREISRLDGNEPRSQTAIIPVIWAPFPQDRCPSAVTAVQRFTPRAMPDPSITRQYEANGIFGLMRLRDETAYDAVLWRIAQNIADLHYSYRVEPRLFRSSTELRNIFREQES
jgi:hypothetical protein